MSTKLEGQEIRRNPWVIGAAALPLYAVPIILALAVLVHPAALVFLIHSIAIGTLTTFWAWQGNPWPRRPEVKVEVDERTLSVGEKKTPRSALTRGIAVPRGGRTEVHLSKPGPDVELSFETEKEARTLLSALGFDADQSVAVFRTMSRAQASTARSIAVGFGGVVGIFGSALAASLVHPGVGAAAMLLGFATLFTLLFMPSRVEIGADGVLVRWIGQRRFISHSEIEDVTVSEAGFGRNKRMLVTLLLSSGELYAIPSGVPAWDNGKAAGMAKRILDARDVFRRGGAQEQALLSRGKRPHAPWIAALRGREAVDLRSAAVPDDELWRVVEDNAAEPVERAAAAIALGKDLATPARERLVRAARATVTPKLRVVLESAPDAEDGDLAEQLEELETSGAKRSKKKKRR